MPRVKDHFPTNWNMKDLLKYLGNISSSRIRLKPAPGTATEKDVIDIEQREDRLYELVEGVLVEKIMGAPESYLAMELGRLLGNFVADNDLGFLLGADGTIRLMPGLVRIPDICFTSWNRVPQHEVPFEAIPDLAPDLAIEVLSKGNTKGEMKRKLKEYFLAGVRLVWFVRPVERTVEVFTAPDQSSLVTVDQALDGGAVLPGFRLPLKQLFRYVPPAAGEPDVGTKTPRKNNARKDRDAR
jgi:Uma2 family endonuclease